MVSFIQGVILSIVQGITEWFPISSSGHLAIAQTFLNVNDLGFLVYLHFASVIAVIILFWKDIIDLFAKRKISYMMKIIIAIIPAVALGYLIEKHIKFAFTSLIFIGIFFFIFGFFIYFTKYAKEEKAKPTVLDAIVIGIAQMFSLLPGVSRSGMTMGSGLILGLKKAQAIKFSFLLAIPIIMGASLVEARNINLGGTHPITFLTSFTITLFISLLTIKYLIRIINSEKFYLFGIYNMILGIILIISSLI